MITGIVLGVLILVVVIAAHSIVDDMKRADEYKCPIDYDKE
jgi:hypothetical protein